MWAKELVNEGRREDLWEWCGAWMEEGMDSQEWAWLLEGRGFDRETKARPSRLKRLSISLTFPFLKTSTESTPCSALSGSVVVSAENKRPFSQESELRD